MNIKLNLVEEFDEQSKVGDGYEYFNSELGYMQLTVICPGCGKQTAPLGKMDSNGKHRFYKETLSVTPSIIHDKEHGGCGWHGFLTNGEFIKA